MAPGASSRGGVPRGLSVGLVTAYPPSTGPLSEYGWHLVNALAESDRISRLHVLADRAAGAAPSYGSKVDVRPCWSFGNPLMPVSVIRAAQRLHLDALWFNLHMTSAGNNKASWFAGTCAPAIARAAGFRVIVTLHNMLGLTDLTASGVRARRLDLAAAHLATRSLGAADMVCALRPEYVSMLKSRYRLRRVAYVPHGALGSPAAVPAANDGTRILALGHFGTYKRLEPLIDAVDILSREGVAARLTIGGSDSRHSSGYLDRVAARCVSRTDVEFLGYVPEADMPALFQSAALCVLPYSTMTGMSGVAILAATHGVPMIASDIPAFRSLEREGMRLRFFEWPESSSLAGALRALLRSPDERRCLALANLAYIRRQPMTSVAATYLDLVQDVLTPARVESAEERPTNRAALSAGAP